MRAFEIPEERSEQIAWLESELVGTQIHSLVAELQAVHGRQSGDATLPEEILPQLREHGLSTLSDKQFSRLLRQPSQLLAIQRDVLENGGDYWNAIAAPTDLGISARLAATQMRLKSDTTTTTSNAQSSNWKSNATWAMLASLATAAVFMLFIRPPNDTQIAVTPPKSVEPSASNTTSAWGFEKFARGVNDSEEQLQPPLDRESYLRELAKAADAWTNKTPDTSQALAQRIGEFRMGCSSILLATHRPLSQADRQWLHDRCQSWASALDRHLAALESGESPESVRAQVDATVIKIAAALQGRADTPTG